jgi:hypothetical protein
MSKIYITYCSKDKNGCYKGTGEEVAPDELYTGERIQSFMSKCKDAGVKWAIFSDKYSVWGQCIEGHDKKEWYDKPPDDVSENEFGQLLKDFNERLREYEEIWFFYKITEGLHPLYSRLISKSNHKIKLFFRLSEIKP